MISHANPTVRLDYTTVLHVHKYITRAVFSVHGMYHILTIMMVISSLTHVVLLMPECGNESMSETCFCRGKQLDHHH